MRNFSSHHAMGFSLIELAAALVVVALVAGMAALSLAGPYRAARMEEVVDQIRGFDAASRDYAQRWNRPVRIEFNLDDAVMRRLSGGEDKPLGTPLSLPRGFGLERAVLLEDDDRGGGSAHEWVIPCSARGWTPSYALVVLGPSRDRKVLVFAGMTGQLTVLDHDKELNDVLATLQR